MKIMKSYHFISFIYFLILISSTKINAQQAQSFGIKAGLTTTTLTNQGNFNVKPGLQAGAYAKLGGREALFFKAEFLLTQKGAWSWGDAGLGNFSLYYIDLPLMFGIDVFEDFTLNIGIQPGLLIGGTIRNSDGEGSNWRNISNDLARMDFSTLFGAEYELSIDWFLGARFNYSFVPIQNYQGELTIQNNGELLANKVFQFYIGRKLK